MYLVKAGQEAIGEVRPGHGVKWAANDVKWVDDECIAYYQLHSSVFTILTGSGIMDVGTSSADATLTAGTPLMSIYSTTSSTSGSTNAEPFYLKSTMTGIGGVGGRARFHTYTNVAVGGWVNGLKGQMEFGSAGATTGLASAICAEMTVPNRTLPSGAYYCLEAELNPGASTVSNGGGTQMGFLYLSVNTNVADFCDYGYIMSIQGLGSADTSHVFQTNTDQPTHALRILVGSTPYYLLMTSEANATE